MREILFRGKRTDNGKWVEGELLHDMQNRPYLYWKTPKELPIVFSDHAIVTPATLGQYIGLTDKNGKKIFEGDIIKFHKFRYEPDWVGVVGYDYCSYIVTGRMPLAYEKRINEEPFYCPFEVALSSIDKATIKVIGNIHDNPELLKEGRL